MVSYSLAMGRLGLGCLTAILLSSLLGMLVLRSVLRHRPPLWLALTLAPTMGLWLSAGLLFVHLLLFDRFSLAGLLLLHAGVLALLGLLVVFRRSEPKIVESLKANAPEAHPCSWKIVFFGLGLALMSFIAISAERPWGGWDAWAIWNLRSHFLLRAGSDWTQAFRSIFPHPDYPLGLPLAICWGDLLAGGETTLMPRLVAALFTFASAGLLGLLLHFHQSPNGRLAALTLLATPLYLEHGTSQYADTPLAFFILAAVGFTTLAHNRQQVSWAFLGGLSAALAAWTKNEGLLFVVVLSGSCIFHGCVQVLRGEQEKILFPLILGLLCFLPLVLLFKGALSPTNEIFQGSFGSRCSWERGVCILSHTLRELTLYKKWVFFALAAFVFLALRWNRWWRARYRLTILSLGGMIAGYALVFLGTPEEIQWHLNTAMSRLMLHLWPLTLFAVFLLLEQRRLVRWL